ncbi:MAG: hypothetical protein K2N06_11785 [Oscillospiraceae bacterium]|nr:hypothetical protein [Oscillospiraceae bacterium]
MSIFGRKEIAQLKKELETSNKRNEVLQSEVAEFKEKYSRYFSALNQSNKEIENYKSELLKANTEAHDYKRKYAELLANTPEFTIPGQISADAAVEELARLKEKCADYEKSLNNVNRENAKYRQDISVLRDKVKKLEDDYNDLFNSIEFDDECRNNSSKTKDPFYEIVNDVRDEPKLMASIYLSKKDFFSPYEYRMYNLLENMIYDFRDEFGDLAVFSKMRLADIVGLFEQNYNTGERSFCDCIGKNPNKKGVCELIDRFMSNFNNNDYKRAFLFPLLRSHIDFLICDHNEGKSNPILAIEVHGSEHDRNSTNPDWKRIHNDSFKISLFNPQNNAMKIRLLIVKNQELNNAEKLRNKVYKAIKLCLDCENIIDFVKGKKWNNVIYNNPKRIYVNNEEILLTDSQAEALESMGAILSKSKGNIRHYEYKGVKYVELGENPVSSSLLHNKFADKLMEELDKAGIKYQAKCAKETVISVATADKQSFDTIKKDLTNSLNNKGKQTQT